LAGSGQVLAGDWQVAGRFLAGRGQVPGRRSAGFGITEISYLFVFSTFFVPRNVLGVTFSAPVVHHAAFGNR